MAQCGCTTTSRLTTRTDSRNVLPDCRLRGNQAHFACQRTASVAALVK